MRSTSWSSPGFIMGLMRISGGRVVVMMTRLQTCYSSAIIIEEKDMKRVIPRRPGPPYTTTRIKRRSSSHRTALNAPPFCVLITESSRADPVPKGLDDLFWSLLLSSYIDVKSVRQVSWNELASSLQMDANHTTTAKSLRRARALSPNAIKGYFFSFFMLANLEANQYSTSPLQSI